MILVQTIFVILLLVVMVMLLLGVSHLFSGNFNTKHEDLTQLRQDVEDKDEVISDQSVFHGLVAGKEPVLQEHKSNHDPLTKRRMY